MTRVWHLANYYSGDVQVRGKYPSFAKRIWEEENIAVNIQPGDEKVLKEGTVDFFTFSYYICCRYGEGTFPTGKLREDKYKVGDIVYWPPAGSPVILYEQDGEEFERQHLGHIDSGAEIFKTTGDVDVTFELAK